MLLAFFSEQTMRTKMGNEKRKHFMEKNRRYFYISLIAMSLCNIATSCMNIFDIEIPDFLFIVFIIVTLGSVFSLIYFSIKLWLGNMDDKKQN